MGGTGVATMVSKRYFEDGLNREVATPALRADGLIIQQNIVVWTSSCNVVGNAIRTGIGNTNRS